MNGWFRGIVLTVVGLFVLLPVAACSSREHREIRMSEERHESPVVEEDPGEMVVE